MKHHLYLVSLIAIIGFSGCKLKKLVDGLHETAAAIDPIALKTLTDERRELQTRIDQLERIKESLSQAIRFPYVVDIDSPAHRTCHVAIKIMGLDLDNNQIGIQYSIVDLDVGSRVFHDEMNRTPNPDGITSRLRSDHYRIYPLEQSIPAGLYKLKMRVDYDSSIPSSHVHEAIKIRLWGPGTSTGAGYEIMREFSFPNSHEEKEMLVLIR